MYLTVNGMHSYRKTSTVNAQLISGLTMSVNIPQLIVHVEEAPEALLSCGHWPVTCQDIFVELKVFRGL